mmetsp:Transcript_4892/g.6637  ORF Transcript_4892/g.6637 Transcript_4892/m.6637 type:complete len:359 (-) Transcript_4892:107-1183(-)|eukprot:CAMPEP_0196581416 /NCGR_PEP_ID=MMETSP1081-20130531/33944_1 /TAXON_ID=36882 /ORGANISM="Pyramimonas amylifera, Strain CCMP720" /LENGTH=358 /DNA_ID=CAMNT_0041901639 /DNA_START=86 /DNA_END=1162 /DNA_ORIENTATION=+
MSIVQGLSGSSFVQVQRKESNIFGNQRSLAVCSRSIPRNRPIAIAAAKKEDERIFTDIFLDRRTLLASVSIGVAGMLGVTPAQAINTTSTPKPFVTDSEKYLGRPGETLGPAQMVRMRSEFKDVVKTELMSAIPKMSGAYPGLLKLAFMDATTFDIYQRFEPSGGANGSVHLRAELARPENKDLASLVTSLEVVKSSIDSAWVAHATEAGSARAPSPISWADLLAMAACVATIQKWGGSPEGGFPMRQGRVDTADSDPQGRALPFSADFSTAKDYFSKRNISTEEMLPLWMEVTDNLDSVKASADGTALLTMFAANPDVYKKKFMSGFTKLTSLGSSFDAYAYFYDESPFKGKVNKGL